MVHAKLARQHRDPADSLPTDDHKPDGIYVFTEYRRAPRI